MAERKIKWTDQQLRAITERGSDILVTASAGTGKTAVLSGRCVNIVCDKSVCPDLWSILVLTFTNAAAEQMRSRIAEQLKVAFAECKEQKLRQHLRQQLILLQGAEIGTIHSFCKRLITEYFYILGLDPTFGVIESDEQRLLKAEVLEKTIDWAWEQSNLRQGLERLLSRRDLRTNDGFLSKIVDLSDFLDNVISRRHWYERASLLAEAVNPYATDLGKRQTQIIIDKLRQILNRIRHAQKLYRSESSDTEWIDKWEKSFAGPVMQCIGFLEAGQSDKCARAIKDFAESKFKYKPKGIDEFIAELIQKTTKEAVKKFEELSDFAVLNPDYLDKIGRSAGLQMKVVVELVKKFEHLYSQAKRTINCLDFADLEHYALQLLADKESLEEDKLSPSQTALELRRKYKYIFVDEYQDINPVQQAILGLLSSGGNVFVVGDVKQSIYAFRGAEPRIFIKNLAAASCDPGNAPNGLRVDLNTNWRSGRGVLDFVNKVFGRTMTSSFGGIDYDESAKLRPAAFDEAENGRGTVVEFHILDEKSKTEDSQNQEPDETGDDGDLNIYSGRHRQAAMIAQRIREMVGAETGKSEFQIYDKKQNKLRDVEYRDIVVLMRSLAQKANDYVEVFQLAGVPVVCEAATGYFEATEISDLVCLLKVLDNSLRDIELAAVLRSPIFNVSDTELAKIKIHSSAEEQPKSFYDCVLGYCSGGRDKKLADRLKEILAAIERWRMLAQRGNLADLIWLVYRQTNYLSFVLALPNGQVRRSNLLKLHERAVQFEDFVSSRGTASLRRFVEFIEKLQEAGQEWGSVEPQAQTQNAVRIISVHKSKGLEFPVVFLAELNGRFNKSDIQSDFLIDAGHTLGLRIIEQQTNSKLSSLAHQVIAEEKLLTNLAEEMRILYVAMTRARERLVLIASEKIKSCRQIIASGLFFGDGPVPDWQLYRCQSPLEWVLFGLADQRNLHVAFETGLAKKALDSDLFGLKIYDQMQLQRLNEYIDKLKKSKLCGVRARVKSSKSKGKKTQLFLELKKALGWRYKFDEITLTPAKRSVTQLTHHGDEYLRIDYSRALQQKPKAVSPADSVEAHEGRLIGTATHLVITHLDLTKPITKEAVKKTKEKLLGEGAITEEVAGCVDERSIARFFESELGKKVLGAKQILREWPFTYALPVSAVDTSSHQSPVACHEIVVVQGVIDMLVQTLEGLLIIDFKTDRIAAEEVAERAEVYREQLELYGRAAETILKTKLAGKWLYFLKPELAVEV